MPAGIPLVDVVEVIVLDETVIAVASSVREPLLVMTIPAPVMAAVATGPTVSVFPVMKIREELPKLSEMHIGVR
jgi:hypothetical protein